MNKLKYILCAVALLPFVIGCKQELLETAPSDSGAVNEVLKNVGSAQVLLDGTYSLFFDAGWSVEGNYHQASMPLFHVLAADVMGDDFYLASMGSGWFWFDQNYNVKPRFSSSAWRSYDVWNAYYHMITQTNYMINASKTMSGDKDEVELYAGQAYALRAYAYFQLAQWFCRDVKFFPSDPGVPLYTEVTTKETPGKPRGLITDVYKQINADLDQAITLLTGKGQVKKSYIDEAIAYTMKARVNMTEGNWSGMKDATEKALAAAKNRGVMISKQKGMNSINEPDVVWGFEIISSQSKQWAALFSHMDHRTKYGQRANKRFSIGMYDRISDTDFRKTAWFLPLYTVEKDENGNESKELVGYNQTKFQWAGDPSSTLGDYIYMRIEEIYLMLAEAECRLGNDTKAREYLMTLMKERDPEYSADTLSGVELGEKTTDRTGSLLEAIIDQRRIELFGEYGRIFDIRRLGQTMVRRAEDGHPNTLGNRYFGKDSYAWVLTIPQAEFDGNKSLSFEKDQNPVGDKK